MSSRNQQTRGKPPAGPSIIADYRLLPGVPDEMIDPSGAIRPGWDKLMAAFDALGPTELAARVERADQYLRDAGVFYRKYDGAEGKERAWPLAHIPLLIDEADWVQISSGLTQRAELLEAIVADIYGNNTLVQEGLLPPELIAQNGEFLRPLVGTKPVSGHYLHFCAFELGRGPDGSWWVLGDRTQAPSGAGFALENRVATTRALSEIYASLNINRLAGFFRGFRDALFNQAQRDGGRVGILTPGQLNETYFEHAYIARYLGLMLLEGEDLVVEDGQVMVRTVAGLKPVSVLWRRLDASFADPLELRYDSHIGTPGMVEALRAGSISMINALGTGIMETRALAAFMPRLCKHLLGTGLELPEIATWWCGQGAEREFVLDNFDSLMIGPAFSTQLPFDDLRGTALGASMTAEQKADLKARIAKDGGAYVGQEPVRLSTAPVYVDGKLEPRPITLRVYAARTEAGWTIMPGGFARVGSTTDTSALAMQRGGQAADVWVLSSKPVEQVSLLPREGEKLVRNAPGNLPSRAADNLIWLGRYAERCEATVRILRAYNARLAELSKPDLPILTHCAALLETLDVDATEAMPQGLLSSIDSAVHSAGQIRDRFSPDGWLALTDLQKTAQRFAARIDTGDDATRAMTVLLRKLAGFSGLVHENMYRFAGWRFLELGRRLERAMQLARITGWLTAPEAPDGSVEMLLEIGDSVMSHRRRYSVTAGALSAVDLLVLDPLNPRSVLFQLADLREQIEALPGGIDDEQLSPAAKLALEVHTDLVIAEASNLTPERLDRLADDLGMLSSLIAAAYFT
ncbi:putative circularly permuted ATP-grasp superfamily protein/putative alpha-E superfamily protein [Devosia subaequoris]|uniref:Putative circularly permuted ATP-grasp superfamily protein/putative alpha-E superfamily protein n=1 Tax=Devosia subaequoris TaxID=395930 RepID=A0A7W6NBF2_9HYPH|nr:circularly permuted type 2 ATP-grasp protein [Devosia subaequoris]MBB4051972.1 putative circularly permuted ATP-grasp superfamily protein/putative alpha-E superfamily protein [Devosia subaequoris]MCP1210136.1 circularly permuted type 2 ATP-grasp protein [Devosia subaequoris]